MRVPSLVLLWSGLLVLLGSTASGQENSFCKVPAGRHCTIVSNKSTDNNDLPCASGVTHQEGYGPFKIGSQFVQCVQCFFPHHCLVDNQCAEGTAGDACERCKSGTFKDKPAGYYAVGSICLQCSEHPWYMIIPIVVMLIFISGIIHNGLTAAVCTKMKQLFHILQFVLLTSLIKIQWTQMTSQMFQIVEFSSLNPVFLHLECYLGDLAWPLHYQEWFSTLVLLTVVVVLAWSTDRYMEHLIIQEVDADKTVRLWTRRSQLRRATAWVLATLYMTVAVSATRANACSALIKRKYPPLSLVGNSPETTRDVYLFDHRQVCDSFSFQNLNFFCTLYGLVLCVCCPVVLTFYTLRTHKWDLLENHRVLYGSLYESFKNNFVFWEATLMLRKLVAVLTCDIYPFTPLFQVCVNLAVTVIYLLAVLICRPYGPANWGNRCSWFNIHNFLEVIATAGVGLLQGAGLVQLMQADNTPLEAYLVQAAAATLGFSALVWLLAFFAIPWEHKPDEDVGLIYPEISRAGYKANAATFVFWVRNKAGEGVDAIQLRQRQANLDF